MLGGPWLVRCIRSDSRDAINHRHASTRGHVAVTVTRRYTKRNASQRGYYGGPGYELACVIDSYVKKTTLSTRYVNSISSRNMIRLDNSVTEEKLEKAIKMERRRVDLNAVLANCRAFQKLKSSDVQLQCRNDCPEYQA